MTAECDGLAQTWNVADGKQKKVLHGHDGEIWSLKIGADGRFLISASADKTAVLWDVCNGKPVIFFVGTQWGFVP